MRIADPLPPFHPGQTTDFNTLLAETLPDLFGNQAPEHNCIYLSQAGDEVR
jgi:hypothetical protein